MIKSALFMVLLLIIAAGCGKIEQTSDSTTSTNNPPNALNCQNDTPTNNYGCYDTNVRFPGSTGDLLVEDGKVWSVYKQSNTNRTKVFYDVYLRGYDFSVYTDYVNNYIAAADKQEQTDGYNIAESWGINDAGTEITLSEDGAYTYGNQNFSDGCFEVSNNGETLKLCRESLENRDANESNTTGLYFGPTVRFGNRTNYDFVVTEGTGEWSISDFYGSNVTKVKLADNGTTDSGGEWGVSADGKIMEIKGVRYLVFQYLDVPETNCIFTYELSGGTSTSDKWKLCKL